MDFLEKAGAAREAATGIRRHLASLQGSAMGSAQKRSDRLDAHGAELEYRWLAVTAAQERLSQWRPWSLSWLKLIWGRSRLDRHP